MVRQPASQAVNTSSNLVGVIMKVFVSYNENRTGCDSLSNELYSQREDTHIDFQLKEVSFTEPLSWYKEPLKLIVKLFLELLM